MKTLPAFNGFFQYATLIKELTLENSSSGIPQGIIYCSMFAFFSLCANIWLYLYSQYFKYLHDILGSPCRGHGNWYFERVLWMENYWVQHVCFFVKSAFIHLCSFYMYAFGKSEHYICFLDNMVLFGTNWHSLLQWFKKCDGVRKRLIVFISSPNNVQYSRYMLWLKNDNNIFFLNQLLQWQWKCNSVSRFLWNYHVSNKMYHKTLVSKWTNDRFSATRKSTPNSWNSMTS